MRRLRSWRIFLFLIDVALIDFSYFFAFALKFPYGIPATNLQPFLHVLPYISALAFGLLWAYDLYIDGIHQPTESYTSILLIVILLNIVSMALAFWLRGFAFPRTIFVIASLLQVAFLAIWRWAWWVIKSKIEGLKHMIVVGHNGEASSIAAKLAKTVGEQNIIAEVVEQFGCVTDDSTDSNNTDSQKTSSLKTSALEAALGSADVVYIGGSVSREQRESIVTWCASKSKEIYLVPELYDIMLHDAVVTRIGDQPILRLERLSLTPWQQLVKRIEDLFLAIAVGSVGLVLSPFIILAIRFTSPGPILFRQLRTGQDGEPFNMYKFRTMVADAEKDTGPVLASENDSRITPIGRFLRTTRLDEIPQILNILKGDMSFVGPRPERPVFVEQFTEVIPAYAYRFKVKPGITGLAQVKGNYDTDVVDKLRYDLYYIRNYSLLLDLKIILQTIKVILTPEAARGVTQAAVITKAKR